MKLGNDGEAVTIKDEWASMVDSDPVTAGFEAVHTFEGSCGIEMVKHVVFPIRQAIPRKRLRGWVDDFDMKTEDVLILTEETHADRKPVSIYLPPLSTHFSVLRRLQCDSAQPKLVMISLNLS